MNHTPGQLDTRIQIVTPENIAFEYRLAGPFRRLPAYLIDFALWLAIFVALCLLLMAAFSLVGFSGGGFGTSLVLWFLLAWFYDAFFETYLNGQTPGKRITGIRVLGIDGQPISGMQAVLRSVLRAVDFAPFGYQFGLLSASLTPRYQRLGDLVAGTMVVVEDRRRLAGPVRVTEPDALRLAAELPVQLKISPSLARALSSYVTRRRSLPWQRRVEIARHVAEPLRQRFGLPANTSYDLFLCALYHRAFIAEHPQG